MVDDVLDALMDDGIPERSFTGVSAGKFEGVRERRPAGRASRLSEVELAVLRALRDTKKVRLISRITGYPEVVVTKAIERLIEKGYIDEELSILREPEAVIGRSRKPGKSSKLLLIDVAIAIAVLVLVIAIAYYFFT